MLFKASEALVLDFLQMDILLFMPKSSESDNIRLVIMIKTIEQFRSSGWKVSVQIRIFSYNRRVLPWSLIPQIIMRSPAVHVCQSIQLHHTDSTV